ncbi:hypothetical protein V6N12_049652 [Hibiscus sabdariffa]|uniref:Uncharacterized protein n=1 Tax=Hibiscus sabdariffa TaxID=183260 RepID=A0ABR2GBV7_9ROSI
MYRLDLYVVHPNKQESKKNRKLLPESSRKSQNTFSRSKGKSAHKERDRRLGFCLMLFSAPESRGACEWACPGQLAEAMRVCGKPGRHLLNGWHPLDRWIASRSNGGDRAALRTKRGFRL